MSEIVESLWQKLYTNGCKVDYQNLWNYCHDNGFVYHPEAAMTDDYTFEEQHQLFNWLEEHLDQKSEEDEAGYMVEDIPEEEIDPLMNEGYEVLFYINGKVTLDNPTEE